MQQVRPGQRHQPRPLPPQQQVIHGDGRADTQLDHIAVHEKVQPAEQQCRNGHRQPRRQRQGLQLLGQESPEKQLLRPGNERLQAHGAQHRPGGIVPGRQKGDGAAHQKESPRQRGGKAQRNGCAPQQLPPQGPPALPGRKQQQRRASQQHII